MGLRNNSVVTYIELNVINKGQLRIGDEEGILIDKVTGRAYIPGTSFAGALRNYMENENGSQVASSIFGDGENESKLYIYDSVANNNKGIDIRPGIRINAKLGSNAEGGLFQREGLTAGHEFDIKLKLFNKDFNERNEMIDKIYDAINAIDIGVLRIGSYKTQGGGILEIRDINECTLDLKNRKDLATYLLNEEKLESIKQDLVKKEFMNEYVRFNFKCVADTPILSKGRDTLDSTLPDGQGNKNGNDSYIIPASSIKGSFRNGFSKIAKFKNEEELIKEAFGGVKEEKDGMGKIYFEDLEFKNKKDNAEYNRIKIDKFTGGTMNGALLNDKPVKGELEFNIIFKRFKDDSSNEVKNVEEKNNKIIGVMIYTIKDLLDGILTLGGTSAIGRGKVKGHKLEIFMGKDKCVIDFENNKSENIEKIEEVLKYLN